MVKMIYKVIIEHLQMMEILFYCLIGHQGALIGNVYLINGKFGATIMLQ